MSDSNEPTSTGETAPVPFSLWQIEIMRQWANQKSTSEAARVLGISEHTFQTHLKRMRRKLGVNRTFDVYRYLTEHGLL